MCGIACIFNISQPSEKLRPKALSMAKKIRHRGPDWSGIYCGKTAILAHERLSIVDPQSGGQPLYATDGKQVLAVNGEIYNHRDIRSRYAGQYAFQTGSDCEVILALYRDKGIHFLEDLSGIFAFALYDEERDEFLIARDPIGVIPLYIGRDSDGTVYCASELKALEGFCEEYEVFLPGHYYWSCEGQMKRWYRRDWENYGSVKNNLSELPAPEAYAPVHRSQVVLPHPLRYDRFRLRHIPVGAPRGEPRDLRVRHPVPEAHRRVVYAEAPEVQTLRPEVQRPDRHMTSTWSEAMTSRASSPSLLS